MLTAATLSFPRSKRVADPDAIRGKAPCGSPKALPIRIGRIPHNRPASPNNAAHSGCHFFVFLTAHRLTSSTASSPPYLMTILVSLCREEGVAGLWTGLVPNVTRVAIITAAELAAYDEVKEGLMSRFGMSDGVACHLLSGCSTAMRSLQPSGIAVLLY